MKISKYITNLLMSLYKSIKRFPLTIVISIAFVIVMIFTSEIRLVANKNFIDNLQRISMIIALAFPLSICIKLCFEKKEIYKLSHIVAVFIVGGLILTLYYFFMLKDFNMISTSRYVGLNIILYIAFIYIPYLKSKDNLEMYVIKIGGQFFITIIYSLVLYLGLSAILATIDKLLEIKVPSDFYYYTFLIVAGIFAPTYYLGGLPLIKDKFTKEDYPGIFKILVLYIIMPLIAIYTVILYMYFAKIIITVKWPVGLVSNLVLWYAVVSAAVLFFISPIYKENKFAVSFMKILPKSILPLILLMFFSIGIRIRAYGITENRYYVIALSLWVFGVMIYFSFTRNFKNILLSITLSIIILIAVLGGPLSSYNVSITSQNNRLEKILVSNTMLNNDKIVKNISISEKDKNEITSILDYFNRSHSFNDIKYLPKDFKTQDTENIFGFPFSQNNNYTQNNFAFNSTQTGEPVNIAGYDYMFDSRNGYNTSKSSKFNINYDSNSNVFKVYQLKDVIYTKDLNVIAKVLVDKYGMYEKQNNINQTDMSFEEDTSGIKIKFFIVNLYGTRDLSTDALKINGIDYYVIIKIK